MNVYLHGRWLPNLPGCSWETSLVKVTRDLHVAKFNGGCSILVYLQYWAQLITLPPFWNTFYRRRAANCPSVSQLLKVHVPGNPSIPSKLRQLVTLPLRHHFFEVFLWLCSAPGFSPKTSSLLNLHPCPDDLTDSHGFKNLFCFLDYKFISAASTFALKSRLTFPIIPQHQHVVIW